MRLFNYITVGFCLLLAGLNLQMSAQSLPAPPVDMNQLLKSDKKNKTEAIVEEVQAQLIKTIFTDPMFATMGKDSILVDEEMASSAEFQMMNDYMSTIMAKRLAERDALGLEDQLLRNIRHMEAAR